MASSYWFQSDFRSNISFEMFHNHFNPLIADPIKWSNTLKQFVDHFKGLVLKGLTHFMPLVSLYPLKTSENQTVSSEEKTLTQVFYYELCESFKNTFFTEHLRASASAVKKMKSQKRV